VSPEAIITLIISAAGVVLFISERLAPDVVALLILAALGLTGVLSVQEMVGGFSSPVILTLIGIFMLTGALANTGVAAYLSRATLALSRRAGSNWLVTLLAGIAALASLLMNTVASVALVAPVARRVALQRGTSPSRLLMPVSFGALLGGMATLLTTANLIVSGVLEREGLPGLNLLAFFPVGAPIALVGIVYLALASERLLPERSPSDQMQAIQQARQELTQTYRLRMRLHEAYIEPGSPLIGRTLAETDLGRRYGMTVSAVIRARRVHSPPERDFKLQMGDWLLIQGRPEETAQAAQELRLTLSEGDEDVQALLFADDAEIAEVTLSPRSRAVNRTLGELGFRERYQLNVLGIWQEGRPIRSYLADYPLRLGSAMLVQGRAQHITLLTTDPDFLVLTSLPETPRRPERAALAAGILILFLIVIAFNWLPVALAALIAGVAVIVTGCASVEQARASIQWQVLFLIGGMLPLATALEKTGAAALIIAPLARMGAEAGPHALLAVFFLLAVLLAQATSSQAAALLVAPLAIGTAQAAALNTITFAVAVGIAASTAFLSPVAHPANLLVLGPGGYRFEDYARLGLPLVLISALGVLVLTPLVYPF